MSEADSFVFSVGDGLPVEHYLHPDYWQPHVVGDRDAIPARQRIPTRNEMRAVRQVTAEYGRMIDAGGSTLPITTFNTGDEFDASAFAPQSLLGIDVEYLYVFDPTARINAEAYEDIPVPERPQQFWPRFTLVMADSSDASYGHFASGGVVLPSARNQPQRLVGANFSGMYTDKRLELGSRYIYHPLQVVVGAVSHVIYDARSKAAAVQVFSRINRIDVLTPGVAERKRRSVFELGRKAVGEGA